MIKNIVSAIRRWWYFVEPDPFVEFLQQAIYLENVPRYKAFRYLGTFVTKARCLAVFKIQMKDNVCGLYAIIKIYRHPGWPAKYMLSWSFGDSKTAVGLFNVLHSSSIIFVKEDFVNFLKQFLASVHGVKTMHGIYRNKEQLDLNLDYFTDETEKEN